MGEAIPNLPRTAHKDVQTKTRNGLGVVGYVKGESLRFDVDMACQEHEPNERDRVIK